MKIRIRTFVVVAMASSLAFGVTTVASAGGQGGGHGGGGTTACVPGTPRVSIDNTWAWASPGAWGMPGQELKYAVNVFNADVGCGASSFVVSFSAPDGFAVSMATNTVNVGSASSVYAWANVTSPAVATDGDYALAASVERVGSIGVAAAAPSNSVYKVYSSDTAGPTLFWENPWDGGNVSGRTTYVGFAARDDHAVKRLDVAIDGATVASTVCDNVSSDCQVSYKWSIRRVSGLHSATFTSTDWMGNVTIHAMSFSVN
jgi:hypothetical protein